MNSSEEQKRHMIHFFFDKSENTNQASENINVKETQCSEKSVVKNIDKIMEIVESDNAQRIGTI